MSQIKESRSRVSQEVSRITKIFLNVSLFLCIFEINEITKYEDKTDRNASYFYVNSLFFLQEIHYLFTNVYKSYIFYTFYIDETYKCICIELDFSRVSFVSPRKSEESAANRSTRRELF